MAVSLIAQAISLGLPVFPCAPDKRPACPHGFKDAVVEPGAITALWHRHPGPLIGVPTGPRSNLAVLDIDPQGMPWLRAEARRDRIPATRVHQTRRGGFHLLFTFPARAPVRNSAGRIAPGVDTRGDGGYVVFPPSPGYEIVDESEPAEWPRWLSRKLYLAERRDSDRVFKDAGGDAGGLTKFILSSREGERNCRAFWAACRAGEAGRTDMEAALIASALAIGLSLPEAQTVVRSGLSRGAQDAGRSRT